MIDSNTQKYFACLHAKSADEHDFCSQAGFFFWDFCRFLGVISESHISDFCSWIFAFSSLTASGLTSRTNHFFATRSRTRIGEYFYSHLTKIAWSIAISSTELDMAARIVQVTFCTHALPSVISCLIICLINSTRFRFRT